MLLLGSGSSDTISFKRFDTASGGVSAFFFFLEDISE